MTRTMRRNGAMVEAAFWRVWNENVGGIWFPVSVGEVAREAGCSKPTAQKYLEMLVQSGVLAEIPNDKRGVGGIMVRIFVPVDVYHA